MKYITEEELSICVEQIDILEKYFAQLLEEVEKLRAANLHAIDINNQALDTIKKIDEIFSNPPSTDTVAAFFEPIYGSAAASYFEESEFVECFKSLGEHIKKTILC